MNLIPAARSLPTGPRWRASLPSSYLPAGQELTVIWSPRGRCATSCCVSPLLRLSQICWSQRSAPSTRYRRLRSCIPAILIRSEGTGQSVRGQENDGADSRYGASWNRAASAGPWGRLMSSNLSQLTPEPSRSRNHNIPNITSQPRLPPASQPRRRCQHPSPVSRQFVSLPLRVIFKRTCIISFAYDRRNGHPRMAELRTKLLLPVCSSLPRCKGQKVIGVS